MRLAIRLPIGLALLLALIPAACGNVHPLETSDGGVDTAVSDAPADKATPTVDQACNDLSTGLCNALTACSTFILQLGFGDAATCVSRNNLACTIAQNATGVGRTIADIEGCAHALPSLSCADLVAHKMPAACHDKPGNVLNGAPCGASTQCQSTYCRLQSQQCGVCAPRQSVGAACTSNDQCEAGLTCASSLCVAPGELTQACDDKHPCRDDLYCSSGTGSGTGTCAMKVGAGKSCADTDKACDILQGVACNPTTKMCQTVRVAHRAESCGLVSGTLVLCEAAGSCDGAAFPAAGTCSPAAADGESCGAATANNRNCLQPSNCVVGICRLPVTPSCQ